MWAVMTEEVVIPVEAIYDANNAHVLTEGLLTLVELSHLAGSSRRYRLGAGVDANLPNQWHYTSRVATGRSDRKWRQTLTLQNQELARRLELEARRDRLKR